MLGNVRTRSARARALSLPPQFLIQFRRAVDVNAMGHFTDGHLWVEG